MDEQPLELPEMNVVVAMIRLGIQDAVQPPSKSSKAIDRRKAETNRESAMQWLFSDSKAEWSAQWCADMLGVRIEVIRAEVNNRPAAVYRKVCGLQKARAA